MTIPIERAAWSGYVKEFNQRNTARPTRMEIFGELGAQEAEHDLAFNGITLEAGGLDAPKLQIMLGVAAANERHLTHTITRVTRITPKRAADGRDEVLEIQDAAGGRTLLSFTASPELLLA
jgi:Family of unknown function (DUF5335)